MNKIKFSIFINSKFIELHLYGQGGPRFNTEFRSYGGDITQKLGMWCSLSLTYTNSHNYRKYLFEKDLQAIKVKPSNEKQNTAENECACLLFVTLNASIPGLLKTEGPKN